MFEFLRLNNVKLVLNHLMDKQALPIRDLAERYQNFRLLVQRWEMNHEPEADAAAAASASANGDGCPTSSDTAAADSLSIGTEPVYVLLSFRTGSRLTLLLQYHEESR